MVLPDSFRTRVVPLPAAPTPLGRLALGGACRDTAGTGFRAFREFGLYALVLLLEGNGHYRDAAGRRAALEPGSLICVFPEIGHQYGPDPGRRWREIYVAFEGGPFDAWRKAGVLDPARPVRKAGPVEFWFQRLSEICDPRVPAPETLARLHLFIAQALAGEPAPSDLAWLGLARRRLETVQPDAAAGLQDIARECGLSYESFRKKFRRATGLAPAAYHRKQVMDRAAALMRRADITNAEAAEQLGFCDEFHFSKAFRRAFGRSPSAFRKAPRRSLERREKP